MWEASATPSLDKPQSFQVSTLRQLRLTSFAIDSMATRLKEAYTSMLYKQVVPGEGPGFTYSALIHINTCSKAL